MRRVRLSIIYVSCLLFLLAVSIPQPIRLHILANSDSEADQQVKLKVRDALLQTIETALADVQTREQAREVLLKQGATMLEAAEETLAHEGVEYGARLSIGWVEFPDRDYGSKTYPAGRYEAIQVELGDAEGQNWWCVMYPPLCLGDLQASEGDQGVSFKSGIKELIDKIGG